MNKIQKWIAKAFGIDQGWPVGLTNTPTSYSILNGNIISSEDNRSTYITKGYQGNDIVYGIVTVLADKVRIAPWGVYKVVDESSLKLYKALMSRKDLSGDDFVRAMNYRKKGLQPYAGDGRLNELLKYPNEYCTFSDLVADSSIYKLICGGRMIWAEQLGEGANAFIPQSLHHLPYDIVTIIASRTFPIGVMGYKLDNWGVNTIPKTAVMHDYYFNPKQDTIGTQFFGQSPLKAALKLLDLSNSATVTALSQFQNQGPKTVLFMNDTRFDPADGATHVNDIKKILQSREYGGNENAGKFAISGYPMGSIPVGLSTVDLGILQLQESQLRRFCNVFGAVPSQIFNDPANKSYNNSQEGEKALTSRGALPLINSFRDYFNLKLSNDWGYKGKNIYVDADLTVYSELQDDLKEKWAWIKELPVSWKYKLDLMGLDYEEGDPGLDEVMIPSGFVPIDSMNVVDELLNGQNGVSNSQGNQAAGGRAFSANGRN